MIVLSDFLFISLTSREQGNHSLTLNLILIRMSHFASAKRLCTTPPSRPSLLSFDSRCFDFSLMISDSHAISSSAPTAPLNDSSANAYLALGKFPPKPNLLLFVYLPKKQPYLLSVSPAPWPTYSTMQRPSSCRP